MIGSQYTLVPFERAWVNTTTNAAARIANMPIRSAAIQSLKPVGLTGFLISFEEAVGWRFCGKWLVAALSSVILLFIN